jgi:exopolysaccharide biosynthesis polyprenyl glycosylphosphotransferase
LNPEEATAQVPETASFEAAWDASRAREDYARVAVDRVDSNPRAVAVRAHRALIGFTVLGDLASIASGTLLPALLRFPLGDLFTHAMRPLGVSFLALAALAWLAALSGRGAYWPGVTVARGRQAFQVATGAVLGWVLVQTLAFWLKQPVPLESRLVAGLSLPVTIVILCVFRLSLVRTLARRVYRRLGRGLLLVLGDTDRSRRIAHDLQANDRPGARPVLHVTLSSVDRDSAGLLVQDRDVGEVILDPDGRAASDVMEIAFACFDAGAQVRLASADPRMIVRRPERGGIVGFPPMCLRRFDLTGPDTILKRLVDVAGSAAGLLLLAPVFLALSLAVKLSSPGPALYKQERVGRQGRRFRMYKFRTMRDGNDSRAHEQYLRAHIREGRPAEVTERGVSIYKPRTDPRVTPIGAWLRKLSLDELPQLYNVLRGEMSLVGPRPCLPYEWGLYKRWQKRRLDITPGCTGLWQVTGRSRVRFEDMVILDLLYAHNSTLVSDLKLIAQTLPVMVQGKGAY